MSKDQLATSVRKHFNGAAVSEMEVITELVYKVRNQGKPYFRLITMPMYPVRLQERAVLT